MSVSLRPLGFSDFPLLYQWLQKNHVKRYWHHDSDYTLDSVSEKYSTYVSGYKKIDSKRRPIHAFIIYFADTPIGYIQYYNAYDFPRDGYQLNSLPKSLAAIDLFIGDENYLGKGIGAKSLALLLDGHVFTTFDYAFVDPALTNIVAVGSFSKVGFKIVRSSSQEQIFFMLRDKRSNNELPNSMFNQLAMREPLFHHPDTCGSTKEALLNLTHEGFWEVGASGNVYSREDVITTLLKRYENPNFTDIWEAKDFDVVKIAQDNYLITYVLIQDENRVTRRSTLWRKQADNWVILYHQGTVVGGNE